MFLMLEQILMAFLFIYCTLFLLPISSLLSRFYFGVASRFGIFIGISVVISFLILDGEATLTLRNYCISK